MSQVFVEEKMIDGVLHHRSHTEGRDGTPWTEWEPYTIQALSVAFIAERSRADKQHERAIKLLDTLNAVRNALETE